VRHKTNHPEKTAGMNPMPKKENLPWLDHSLDSNQVNVHQLVAPSVNGSIYRGVSLVLLENPLLYKSITKLIIPSNHKSLNISLPPSPLPSPKRIQHDLRQGDKGSRTATHSAWVATVHASGALMQTLTYIMDVKVIKNKL
jgi:hypothetical protein